MVRRRLVVVAVLITVVLLPAGWYHVSVQPGAALVRWAFESGPAVHAGPGVPLERPGVVERTQIPVAVGREDVPAATVDVYSPRGGEELPVVLWVHGGGFIANSAADLAGYARVIADAGYVVVALDYSLAPEHRYPTPIIQADAALRWVVDEISAYGGDPDRLVLGGDSAGAQLASQLAVTQTDPDFAADVGVPGAATGRVRGVILFCGLYDMDTVGATGFPALRTFLWSYTGHRDWWRYPRIDELSTTRTASAEYPPTLIAVGDADPFASQGAELADALDALGVEVTTEFWSGEGLGHEYQFDFRLPEARRTLATTLTFLEERTR